MAFRDETRDGYDAIAERYAAQFHDELEHHPLDRAFLGVLRELVVPGGRVVDLGSGPGMVTAHLAGLGCDVTGIDLSPRMVELASRQHPHLTFQVGSMTTLALPDASVAGIVARYSIIRIPVDQLPAVFAELHRVLTPGAPLLVTFQTGGPTLTLTDIYGTGAILDFHRHPVDTVVTLLNHAQLAVTTRCVREPAGPENTQHAYLLAHRT